MGWSLNLIGGVTAVADSYPYKFALSSSFTDAVLKKAELELHLDFRAARAAGDELFFPIHRSIVTVGSEQDCAAQHCHSASRKLQIP